ncbi:MULTISPECIES: hypothetical protein [unclassified Novosphingobium]|uniref:hypothetical protein n=1 Tax=unclassified Novosphingobium TaxID=2644732 RepID=UPI000D3137EC|nr:MULTISPECIES: hypothetical protein [unclassified Novosphingobium]PTR06981.1 hypothetical protein C8K11_11733 [Novosphingobium sp. GV055]PUA99867.1 hypothetical protein C8K12_11760 [Novosphingobium sp. GV061]PUB14723.1 hypothetical protein C8K14_11733 [Novosphingobium sp. GV079]PUB38931.1 hypothetical protein C8K10_11760 [Novosphingobium sp. GV027]
MAVSTTNAFDGPFSANGVTRSFPFTFTAQDTGDVAVLLDDQPITDGYSVELYEGGGGTVTFAVAPGPGKLVVWLDPDFTQTTAFENGSAWLAAPVNLANDRAALRDQALSRDLKRCMRIPLGENAGTLPAAAKRKGKYFAFSPIDGTAVLADAVSGDALLRADMASTDANKGATLVGMPGGGMLHETIVPCTTRAALAARANRSVMVYLLEPGRQGYFYWSPADLSAAVAADPAQAFYVPASTGSSGANGAWVRAAVRPGVANLTWFGNPGDGSVSDAQAEAAMVAAFAWLNAVGGRTLEVPAGVFTYTSDKRITANSAMIRGSGCRFQAKNSARLLIGFADDSTMVNGRVVKAGIKAIGVKLVNIAFLPADGHYGSIVTLDFCDETTLDNVEISMYSSVNDVTGLECRWTQWVYLRRVKINVNSRAVWIRLQPSNIQNEDHYHFSDCLFYIGKLVNPPNPAPLSCVQVEKELGNTYGIFEFSMRGCHFLGIPNDATRRVSAIAVKNAASGDSRAIHRLSVYSCFFEDVWYGFDGNRFIGAPDGYDTSRLSFYGCSFLRFGVAVYGKDYSKNAADFAGCYLLQGVSATDGAMGRFSHNNVLEALSAPFANGITRNRFTDKNIGDMAASSAGRLRAMGSVAVAATDTYAVINHGLAATPTKVVYWTIADNTWKPSVGTTALGSTSFNANFTPPGVAATLYWEAEVAYL